MADIGIFGRSKAGKTFYSKKFKNVLHTDDYAYLGWGNCCEKILSDWSSMSGDRVIEGIILPRLLERGLYLDKIIYLKSDRVNEKSLWLDNAMEERFEQVRKKYIVENG